MKLFFCLLMALPIVVSAQQLSEQAEISVITCGPSQEELYTAFGHSAIRVHDPMLDYDAAYNYGVFDFNQPNFYLNFAKGFLYYKLGVYDYQLFQANYVYDNRYVHEQVLNLTASQKQQLFDYLQNNAKPENQSYRYDYFYNNCATKVRDVIREALGPDVVKFDGSYVKTNYSIRELTDIYLQEQPWGDLGIDICLGLPMDKKATPYEYMFLPDYIESGFEHATIQTDGKVSPIVKKNNIINDIREQEKKGRLPNPVYFSGAITVVSILLGVYDFRRRKLSTWFDGLLFGICGAIGFLLFFLWFFTDHNAAARNLNIWWAFPLHLVAVIAFLKNPRWLRTYFLITLIMSIALLIAWKFLPQLLHYAILPIVIAQAIRAYTQFRLRSTAQ